MQLSFSHTPEPTICGMNIFEFTPTKMTELFGEPAEVELADNPMFEEGVNTFYYNSPQVSFYFHVNKLVTISVMDPDFMLFERKIFSLREQEIIQLFAENGYANYELDADWGEKQLIFEEAGVTVFFDNQLVSEIFIDV